MLRSVRVVANLVALLFLSLLAINARSQSPPAASPNPPSSGPAQAQATAPAAEATPPAISQSVTPSAEPGASLSTPPGSSSAATISAPSALASAAKQQYKQVMSAMLLHARDLYRNGDYATALAAYNGMMAATGPDTAWAYAGVARVYLKQNDPKSALSAAQKAIALEEHLAAAHSALGDIYFRQGKFREAEHEYLIPMKERVQDAQAFFGLSRIYRATSNYKLAKTALDTAHAIDPDDPEIRLDWLETLGLKERIAALQMHLAEPNNDDKETAESLQQSLTVMQDRLEHPARVCRLKTPLKSTQTQLTPVAEDPKHILGYALKIKLNSTSATLQLDTGAGGILVTGAIAKKAGVQRLVEQSIGGIGDKGAAKGYVGFVESIQIGELQFENCYVDVVDKKGSLGEDGLIGADVFAHYLVDINFPDKKFKLSELPKHPDQPAEDATLDSEAALARERVDRYIAPEMESYSRIFRFAHMLLMPTSVNDQPFKMFLIDTGAFDNMITPDAARESTKIHGNDDLIVEGLSGKVKKVYETGEVTLTFGHLKQKRSIVSFDLSSVSNSVGTEVSGTLGFGMLFLLDIKIDYRDGLVEFAYDPNRFH